MAFLDFLPVIGQVSSAIGNAVSTNSTNRTNMRINQMNNEFNAAEAEKARQFQLDMWNRENEYNTASAQRSRLEAAGLNPYLMMNGGSSGTASSIGSSASASASSPLSMQRQDFSGISNALSSALQIANQTKDTNANVQYLQGQKNLADAQANNILSNIDWGRLTPEYKRWSQTTGLLRTGLQYQTDRQNLRNMEWSNKLIQAQRVGQLLDNQSRRVLNTYLDEGQRLQLQIMASDYYDRMASGHLKYQQAVSELSKRLLMDAQAAGHRISNKVAADTSEKYIQALNSENQASIDINSPFMTEKGRKEAASVMSARMDALNQEWNYSKRYWKEGLNAINTIGNAVGSAGNLRRPSRSTYVYGNRTYNNY
uniref:DNA pilot protein n=1 Tax=Dulem virus 245 TaxID=3145722 RepID=A0AAU8B8I3_9VIRU